MDLTVPLQWQRKALCVSAVIIPLLMNSEYLLNDSGKLLMSPPPSYNTACSFLAPLVFVWAHFQHQDSRETSIKKEESPVLPLDKVHICVEVEFLLDALQPETLVHAQQPLFLQNKTGSHSAKSSMEVCISPPSSPPSIRSGQYTAPVVAVSAGSSPLISSGIESRSSQLGLLAGEAVFFAVR